MDRLLILQRDVHLASLPTRVVPIGRRLCDPSAPLGGYRVERPEELESSVVGRDGLVLR